jgi:co-chaperonin GroES (HSP10)
MNYAVLGDRVLLKKIEDKTEEVTEGGIVIPLEVSEKKKKNKHIFFGKVVSVGDDIEDIVKVDDEVIFNIVNTQEIEIDGQEYFVIEEKHIIAKKQ